MNEHVPTLRPDASTAPAYDPASLELYAPATAAVELAAERGPVLWVPDAYGRMVLETTDGIPPHVAVWRSVRKHGETKTRKSRRTIALPKQVVEVLEEHMRWQKQERASSGREWSPTGRVFTTRSRRGKRPAGLQGYREEGRAEA
ncbi:hypothetical protein [Streptomyces griseosporeus]|uniref:hypothetical protein n=1 Tax=Streptomyces griseosporeus TaxID=1910 RepID=UPI00167D03E2|nr:hypothetical protein [Streptomyces griseosporeus]GHF75904.1 hypothetical protein GCM10018783_52390 [Streptomyces griseosporeus]